MYRAPSGAAVEGQATIWCGASEGEAQKRCSAPDRTVAHASPGPRLHRGCTGSYRTGAGVSVAFARASVTV